MTGLLRAELLKLRTTRTFVAFAAAAVGLSLLAVVLSARSVHSPSEEALRDVFNADFTSIFFPLLGAIGMAGEWRHRTIAGSVLAAPHRVRLLAAKTLSYAVAAIVLSLAVSVAIMVVGTLVLASRDQPTLGVAELADMLWRNVVVAALLAALGVGIGGVLRNQTVVVAVMLVGGYISATELLDSFPHAAKYHPALAAGDIQGLSVGVDALTPGLALAVSIGWVAVAFAAAAAVLQRRDLV